MFGPGLTVMEPPGPGSVTSTACQTPSNDPRFTWPSALIRGTRAIVDTQKNRESIRSSFQNKLDQAICSTAPPRAFKPDFAALFRLRLTGASSAGLIGVRSFRG